MIRVLRDLWFAYYQVTRYVLTGRTPEVSEERRTPRTSRVPPRPGYARSVIPEDAWPPTGSIDDPWTDAAVARECELEEEAALREEINELRARLLLDQ